MFGDTFLDTSNTEALSPIMEMTAQLVSAYVQKNPVPMSEFPGLIESVHAKLNALSQSTFAEPTTLPEKLKPAVPIKKSVTPDYIVCLEDGKKFKSLKRHLREKLGMTPEQYRTKWGLAPDYPIIAPNYVATRSALAKRMGLGRKPAPEVAAAPASKRGRKRDDPA